MARVSQDAVVQLANRNPVSFKQLLARLAVSTVAQDQGIGMGLLQDAIRRTLNLAEQAGIRALFTHLIDDAARFYQRFGFEALPLGKGQLPLLLKDAKRQV